MLDNDYNKCKLQVIPPLQRINIEKNMTITYFGLILIKQNLIIINI